jgi:hypothetical protein
MQSNKGIISVVIVLGFVLAAGFVALGYGFIRKSSDPDFSIFKGNAPESFETKRNIPAGKINLEFKLPPGAKVENVMASGSQIVVHVANADGSAGILILDSASGDVIRRVNLTSQP